MPKTKKEKKKLHVLNVLDYGTDDEGYYYFFQNKESVLPFVLKLVRRHRRLTKSVQEELRQAAADMNEYGACGDSDNNRYIYIEEEFED